MTPFLALFSFYDGMSNVDAPPPVDAPLYGPALTPAQRIKWFSDFSSPSDRQKKRRDAEKRKRVEIGIIEDEELANEEKLVLRAKERVAVEMKRLEREKESREELEFIMKLLNEDD